MRIATPAGTVTNVNHMIPAISIMPRESKILPTTARNKPTMIGENINSKVHIKKRTNTLLVLEGKSLLDISDANLS